MHTKKFGHGEGKRSQVCVLVSVLPTQTPLIGVDLMHSLNIDHWS